MSKFEDYNRVSRNYDDQRYAMGSDVMAALAQFHGRKPLEDLHVLDAGCGTGNYAKAFIEYGVGKVTLLDASHGMLEKAKEKLSDHISKGKVKNVVEATMPPLPFPDESFDVVMFTLVLHHLETNPNGKDFPVIEETLREGRRVLKKSGILLILSGPTEDVYERLWFVHLNRNICNRHLLHHPQYREWDQLFQNSGLKSVSYMNVNSDIPSHSLNSLLDPEGPLREEWRNCNSYWASATEDELKDVEAKINKMKSQGTLQQFVKDHDKMNGFYILQLLCAKIA
ncbi:hypothetical protein ACF0H5_022056 [Mactra antiquata]